MFLGEVQYISSSYKHTLLNLIIIASADFRRTLIMIPKFTNINAYISEKIEIFIIYFSVTESECYAKGNEMIMIYTNYYQHTRKFAAYFCLVAFT